MRSSHSVPPAESIRIARAALTDEDSRALIECLNAELSEAYPEAGATHFNLDPAEVSAGRGAFLVVYLDGTPVGCGAVRLLDPGTAELKRMYVSPAVRGRGLGRQLVAALEAEARTLGARRLVLETGIRQAAALALYRATGFESIPLYGEYLGSPGTSVCLGKILSARAIACVGVLILAAALLVTEARADRVDRFIEAQLKKQEIPGLAVAVVRDGKVIKAKGYGLADVELNAPVTTRSVFQWASVTKQFTATAIMLLVQDGKLKLDDPVSLHYAKAPIAWSNVTVRHLLTHTSGIKGYTDLPNFFDTVRKDYKPEELLGLVINLPLDFAPGEKWAYSNTGYYLLGLIIEKVSGQTYSEFLATRIFRPLGMETARVNEQFEIIPHRVTGYINRSNRLWRAEFVSPTQPYSAGALVGTVLDLAKWDAALYTDQLMPRPALAEMWSPVELTSGETFPYGYGWQMGEIRGHPFVGHGGGIHGFTSFILRLVNEKLTVIVLANTGASPQSLATSVAGRYLAGLTLSSLKAQPDGDPQLSGRLRKCLADLAATKDSEMLTPQFRENFNRSRRRHATLQSDVKELRTFTFLTEDKPNPRQRGDGNIPVTRLRSYKLTTPELTRYYTFGLIADDQVARLEMSDD